MLTKFEVTNFKNFDRTLTLDLTQANSYEFNQECVVNGIINKVLVYGHNGVGKSNLGLAIFDIISHLTDKRNASDNYAIYTNALTESNEAHFVYEFSFNEGQIRYEYAKTDYESLVYEKITINDKEYAAVDRSKNSILSLDIKGAETLKKDIGNSKISIVAYINNNAILDNDSYNRCFDKFIRFVNGMLFFRTLKGTNYIGFEQGVTEIERDIIEKGNLKDFETFLNNAGIECKLKVMEKFGQARLAFAFKHKLIPLMKVASSGIQSLLWFYYWYQRIRDENQVKFLFIDEFDAFYHHSLAMLIVKIIKVIQAQTIMTTHNIAVMTNELLRPDCYFLMKNNVIRSLANRTVKELREAHSIEKMYKAGMFTD